MPTALKAAAAMVQALQAKGYDQDMAKIALEQVAYADVEQAMALLNEWSGGAPRPESMQEKHEREDRRARASQQQLDARLQLLLDRQHAAPNRSRSALESSRPSSVGDSTDDDPARATCRASDGVQVHVDHRSSSSGQFAVLFDMYVPPYADPVAHARTCVELSHSSYLTCCLRGLQNVRRRATSPKGSTGCVHGGHRRHLRSCKR